MSEPAIIHLIDDDAGFLQSMSSLLQACHFTVRTYSSPVRFFEEFDPRQPGCLIVDLIMEEMNGLALQRLLQNQHGGVPIIFLSGRAEVPDCAEAMKSGAVDFLLKPCGRDALVQAIHRALEKDQALQAKRLQMLQKRSLLQSLTPRERSILDLVMNGALNKEIADQLGIAERTVKFHRGHLMRKLGAHSGMDLMRIMNV